MNLAYSSGTCARKIRQNSIETFFNRTDGKRQEQHHKLCGYVSGAKSSNLDSIFNFAFSGGVRAQKSR